MGIITTCNEADTKKIKTPMKKEHNALPQRDRKEIASKNTTLYLNVTEKK